MTFFLPSSYLPFTVILSTFTVILRGFSLEGSLRFFVAVAPQNDREKKRSSEWQEKEKIRMTGKETFLRMTKSCHPFFSCHPIPLSPSSYIPLLSSYSPFTVILSASEGSLRFFVAIAPQNDREKKCLSEWQKKKRSEWQEKKHSSEWRGKGWRQNHTVLPMKTALAILCDSCLWRFPIRRLTR